MKIDSEKRLRPAVRIWVLCALAVCVTACGRPDPETELNAAAESFSAGNFEDAALRLNYVIQLDPENVRARELRGDVALLLGDYTNAADELTRAIELGAPQDAIALRLAEAWTSMGQIDDALRLLQTTNPKLASQSLFWVLRAEALLAAERIAEAEITLAQAEKISASGPRLLTTKAQIAFLRGNSEAAFDAIGQALVAAPDDPRVGLAYAEILARSDRLGKAAEELLRVANLYRDASIGPRETLSLLGLIQVHLAQNDLSAAEAIAGRLAEQAPNVLSTTYFQGLVNFRRGRYEDAAALVQPLVNSSPDTPQYRSLLGAIQLARGNVGQAEQQFLRVLAISPRDPAAAKLLAETRLRQQRPDAALDALLALQDTAAIDPEIGLLSGIATVQAGNVKQGLLYLEQAAALDPTNELLKLQLARAYLATGRDAEASDLLSGSFGEEERTIEANLLKMFAENRQGDSSTSADIAASLVADYPDDARVLTAVAMQHQLNGEAERARELFRRAAEFETDAVIARLFVAATLVQEGRRDEAEQLLRETIQQQPDNAQASAGLAQLLASRGAHEEAAQFFTRAAENTDSVVPRLALAKMLLRQGRVDAAKFELEKAATAAPDNAEVIALRGVVALVEGRTEESVKMLSQAVALLPDRLGVSLALAQARLANGQPDAARTTLLEALELAPHSFPVRLALGEAELQSGNVSAALSVATDLKVDFPSQAGGYLLEGKVHIASQQFDAAEKSLANAFAREPTWDVLALKIQALWLAGRTNDALNVSALWLAENPGHVAAGLTRGVHLQTAGRLDEALDAYMSVLDVSPNELVALNNAAWVSHEIGAQGALTYAERAKAVAPDNAAVLDTLGWIQLHSGQRLLAVENLSRAAELAPQALDIRYHLSKALVEVGQSARAYEMLAGLLSDQREFEGRDDAERLLEFMRAEVAVDQ